jgi:hypothetical protein
MLDIELSFEISINDKDSALSLETIDILHNIISKKITYDFNNPVDKIKIFSLKNFIPGKMQSVTILSMKVNGENYTDFHKFCSFEMINNRYVDNRYLKKQNVLCFNGNFYFNIKDNLKQFLFFPYYYSLIEDDFIYNNIMHDCDNPKGCLHGSGGFDRENTSSREPSHKNKTWSNVPYNQKILTKGQEIELACFGCSVTYGKSMYKQDCWPQLVSKNIKTKVINFGQPALGADSIYQILKHSLNEFKIKKVIILFPDLKRVLAIFKKSNNFFRLPVVFTKNDHSGTFYNNNFWFNLNEIGRLVSEYKKNLNIDSYELYSKKFILKIKELLIKKEILFLFSSWDKETYSFLETELDKNTLLPYFETIDTTKEAGPYEKFPGSRSHKTWIEKSLNKIK